MLGARPAVRRPDPRRAGERPAIVRASAARPLPPLRPVADFVGLPDGGRTLSGDTAFLAAAAGALVALVVTTLLGVAASGGLAALVSWPYAVVLVLGAVGLPAARGAFRGLALALDHPSPVQHVRPTTPVTILVTGAAPSEATTASLAAQDYGGPTTVVMPGAATIRPVTPLTLVVDAGVVLHPSALRLLVARLVSAPADTAVVAAHALALATDTGVTAEACAAAWTHALDADQRTEHLFAGPLSADSACTLLRTDALTAVPGWALPGSRAALTWRLLERDARVVPLRLRVNLMISIPTAPLGTNSTSSSFAMFVSSSGHLSAITWANGLGWNPGKGPWNPEPTCDPAAPPTLTFIFGNNQKTVALGCRDASLVTSTPQPTGL